MQHKHVCLSLHLREQFSPAQLNARGSGGGGDFASGADSGKQLISQNVKLIYRRSTHQHHPSDCATSNPACTAHRSYQAWEQSPLHPALPRLDGQRAARSERGPSLAARMKGGVDLLEHSLTFLLVETAQMVQKVARNDHNPPKTAPIWLHHAPDRLPHQLLTAPSSPGKRPSVHMKNTNTPRLMKLTLECFFTVRTDTSCSEI